jgi:large-conductance mechanosensitive channel
MSDVAERRPGVTHTIVATKEGVRRVSVKHKRYASMRGLFDEPDDLMREQLGGFINFLSEHAVVGVAIGFIVGLQAQTLIKQLVASFVTPLFSLLVGQNLQNDRITIHGTDPVVFAWGSFIYTLADFVVVLLFIYLVVKIFRLDKLDKKK